MGFSSSSYLKLLQSLLPKGRAWTRSPDSILTQVLTGLSIELSRVDDQVFQLIKERDTRATSLLLTEHELDLGLPDDCLPLGVSIAERRTTANSRLISLGGLNKQYYIDLALTMGYTITIDEFTPFWCGSGGSGEPCGAQETIFYWRVNIDTAGFPIIYFISGASESGDPLISTGIDATPLICYLEKLKPAHTIVIYQYIGPSFSTDFSVDFDSIPTSSTAYLEGAFSKAFSSDFDRRVGGGFDRDEFSIDFDRPM